VVSSRSPNPIFKLFGAAVLDFVRIFCRWILSYVLESSNERLETILVSRDIFRVISSQDCKMLDEMLMRQ
jgi:hypothetical protein